MRQRRIRLHILANLITVPHRHEHVGEHQVGMQIGDFPHGGFTVANGNDVNALIFQGKPHHLLNVAVVVRNQNSGHRTSSDDTLPLWATHNAQPYRGAYTESIGAPAGARVNLNGLGVCRK